MVISISGPCDAMEGSKIKAARHQELMSDHLSRLRLSPPRRDFLHPPTVRAGILSPPRRSLHIRVLLT
jgi:hypothetical protein